MPFWQFCSWPVPPPVAPNVPIPCASSTNKRKLNLPLPYTQIEAITTNDGLNYFLSNEYFSTGPIISPQRFHNSNLSLFLEGYLTGNYASLNKMESNQIEIFPNPTNGIFTLLVEANLIGKEFSIYNVEGKFKKGGKISENCQIKLKEKGIYFINIEGINKKLIVQ